MGPLEDDDDDACTCEYELDVGPLEWTDPGCPRHGSIPGDEGLDELEAFQRSRYGG